MFRHVVVFQWSETTSNADRNAALAALRTWASDATVYGEVRVGSDAGLPTATHDVVVVADFNDEESYAKYAADERHVALVRDRIAPLIRDRAAVQHSW